MPKVKKEAKSKKVKKFEFELTIETGETVHKIGTNNVLEALEQFPQPPVFKTETRFLIKKDGKERLMVLNVAEARRIFANHTALEIFVDRLTDLI